MASERMLLMTPLKIPEDRITRLKEKFPHLDISEVVTPLPNAADFANWKGPGKGMNERLLLSSSIHTETARPLEVSRE